MDDEDFFSLLLRVQGGRMDEQRTELPRLLQTWDGKKNKSVGLLCVPTANVASLLKFLFKEDFFSTPKCFVFGGGVELLYLLIVLKLSKLEQKR